MKNDRKSVLRAGIILLVAFGLWTALIQHVDVRPAGPNGSSVGFAAINVWFHQMTGVHMGLYAITDWLGLVPIGVCLGFGGLGLHKWVKRRSLLRVDPDILLLGVYYVLVILGYLVFEMIPINYRPVLIEGVLEASYPSSTTLLVLSVMPTLKFQADRRFRSSHLRKITSAFVVAFSAFMVVGRLVSGVHWATDIVGSIFLSAGLFLLYRFAVARADRRRTE